MVFEHEDEAIAWFDGQERVLTPEFLKTIPWQEIKQHELAKEFLPVLLYMRDIEKSTEIYYAQLQRTPTGKNPAVKRFMDRWGEEEGLHGDLLNRFLNEAGFETSEKWFEEMKARIPKAYHFKERVMTGITNLWGRKFSGVHMTWGAVQELSTLSGYERLWTLAKHPVLEYLLRAIAREEARHSLFYWSVANILLKRYPSSQKLARYLVDHFWKPVGEGIKTPSETNYLVHTLFSGEAGLALMSKRVNDRIAQLPGFETFHRVHDRIASAGA